jgi:hypothetical protein
MSFEIIVISLFLFLGICFGLLTFSHRHLFSEGPDKAANSDQASLLEGRIFWVMVCTCLWPIMVVTGLHSVWILAKRQKKSEQI